jgi:hypothetical protein
MSAPEIFFLIVAIVFLFLWLRTVFVKGIVDAYTIALTQSKIVQVELTFQTSIGGQRTFLLDAPFARQLGDELTISSIRAAPTKAPMSEPVLDTSAVENSSHVS